MHQHDHQSITAHIITTLYGHVPLKPQPGPPFWVFHHFTHWSLWEKKRKEEETRHDSHPRCGSLCLCLFSFTEVSLCIYRGVFVLEFVFRGPLCSLWPLQPQSSCLWFWSGVWTSRRQFALWLSVRERTSLERVRIIQQGERRPPAGDRPSPEKKRKEKFRVNHITSHASAESKHFMNEENNLFIRFIIKVLDTFVFSLIPSQTIFSCTYMSLGFYRTEDVASIMF